MKLVAEVRRSVTPRFVALAAAVGVPLVGASILLGVTTEDVTQHNGLSSSDPAHLRFFVEHRSGSLVNVAKVVTELGAAPLLAVLALVAAVTLWWRGQRAVVAVAPAVSLGLAAVTASLAKGIVGRVRPPLGIRLVNETEPSFPSGHSTDSAAFYIALALILAVFVLRRPLARAAVVAGFALLAGAIGLSRLVLGVHWPTDVLAGLSLGTISALLVTVLVSASVRFTPPDTTESLLLRARLMRILHMQRRIGLHASPGLT